jgi:hypothetical protein
MSTHDDEPLGGISDEQLPEDLRPTDDNPLAKPLTEDAASPEELDMMGGKTPEESEDEQPEDDDSETDSGPDSED